MPSSTSRPRVYRAPVSGTPRNVAPVNTSNIEDIPVLSDDRRWLFFDGDRHAPGSATDVDIYVRFREDDAAE